MTATPMDQADKQKYMVVMMSFLLLIFIVLTIVIRAKSNKPSPSPEPSVSPSPEISASPISTPSASIKPSPSPKISPSPSPSALPSPSPSPSSSPSPSPSPILKADLYISEYSYNHPPKMGEEFTVRIGIYNQGNTPAGGFWWEWWPSYAMKACRVRIDSMAAHGGQIVNCTYTYGGWSNYTVKAVADADNEVDESDEGNNVRQEQLVPIH